MMGDEPALFGHDGEPTPEARAHARAGDPQTSHDAARSLKAANLRASQEAVLRVLKRLGTGTDVDLVALYEQTAESGFEPAQSPSGIRSRRHELVEAGRVVDTGERTKLASGRKAIVWGPARG